MRHALVLPTLVMRAAIRGSKRFHHSDRRPAQAFIELALVLPILIIILLGLVEVAMFIGRYLDVLDLTREAARFASVRDPFDIIHPRDTDCSTPNLFDFYYDTSCIFSPPVGSANCTDPAFCNGLNPYMVIDSEWDDVVISIYTISSNSVSDVWPQPDGYWALSDHDPDTAHNGNWRYSCQDHTTPISTQPYYNQDRVQASLSSSAPPTKGFVAIEFYYCYNQALNVPLLSAFVPNPLRIHAYTIMPLPAGQPTPTTTVYP